MKILIISDVHGNLPALEYVLGLEKDADLVISLGDVVNYGPWSNECIDVLDSLRKKILLRGNHEEAFITGNYSGNHLVAKAFFDFGYPTFHRQNEIRNYIASFDYKNGHFVHTLNNEYIFPDSEITLNQDVFIGHSHRLFSRNINGHRLVNAGSVGQNRANIDEVNYALWYPETDVVELISKAFSADRLIDEMYNKNYPAICMQYILSKRKYK